MLPLFDDPNPELKQTPDDAQAVARAMALWWTYRPRTAIYGLLGALQSRTASGRTFTQEMVKHHLREFAQAGLVEEEPHRQGFWRLREPARGDTYRALLAEARSEDLHRALCHVSSYQARGNEYYWPVYDSAATIALVRLAFFSGKPAEELQRLQEMVSRTHDWNRIAEEALFCGLDGSLLQRVTPSWRWELARHAIALLCLDVRSDHLPVLHWALAQIEAGEAVPRALRFHAAEALLHSGMTDRLQSLLAGDDSVAAVVLRAAADVQQGRWEAGQAAFETAIKRLKAETGRRKGFLPTSLAWHYPLALLAQQTPRHLELARKFCAAEAGSRSPDPWEGWGLWCHAIDVRLGDARIEAPVFEASGVAPYEDLWRSLLRAWLGRDTLGKSSPPPGRKGHHEIVAELRRRLGSCGFAALQTQLDTAEAVFAGEPAPPAFFARGKQEAWQSALASLQALAATQSTTAATEAGTRLLWSVRLDADGAVQDIEPQEQRRGARGWSKPKPLSLAKLAGNARLEPWDARVARAIRQDRSYSRRYTLDRSAAMMALVGHPAVVLADAPENVVDVVEGTPALEVVREKGRYVLRTHPPLRMPKEEADDWDLDVQESKSKADAHNLITVLRDSPRRIRVVRLTPAQRRAAMLVAGGLSVPAQAEEELHKTLHALSGHFEVHSDHVEAAREVPAESRLRAELSPVGEGLTLRLVVAPLGPDGPRLAPGSGRSRLLAAVAGERVSAERDLAAERRYLDTVLSGLPFLDPPADGVCDWQVDDPEQALLLVETLPRLAGVCAVDWPKGQSVRVATADVSQLALAVRAQRDWFALAGKVQVSEELVLQLSDLLAFAQARKGRFVPMGEGVYVALTQRLRDKLAELAAVAETRREGDATSMGVPRIAAAWLDEMLADTKAETDRDFRALVERLREAQSFTPPVPKALQAQLRPYQEDGYVWAMRLAQAGFGACLADDMGLGKTLQALAVLTARMANGAALVVAPTSVCGNWLAEAQRFAPTLKLHLYGPGDRAQMLTAAGPGDVVVVSYTLLQQAFGDFAARAWHTVIADEAQAIKNASAKRSQAAFELPADFRMALSGTPVENRLGELWAVMRFCNPGLLSSLNRFNERFATPIERDRDRGAQHRLRRLISPFVLRRTKSQVLPELPPRIELIQQVVAGEAEAAHYEALRRQAVSDAEDAASSASAGQARMHILAQLMRLRRAACDPRLVSPAFDGAGAKVQAFAYLAAELSANGHKALVFSQFVDFLALLREPLDAAGIAYQYLDGATPAAERTRRVNAFQAGDGELFLISLKAGGFGLNLTAADYVVIADPWWNPAAEDQAMGRAHRIGQQRPVTVYRLVTKGTLEERIIDLHHEKRALVEGILAEGENVALPSSEELIALMRGDDNGAARV
jgi:superfamily II DNA or RNA helicase